MVAGSGADSGAPVLISPCLLLHISPSGAGAEEPHDHGRQNNDNGQQAKKTFDREKKW